MMYTDATPQEIDRVMNEAWQAFHQYRNLPLTSRAGFMEAIAIEMESSISELLSLAMSETNLPEARLRNEIVRTIFQLRSYAQACQRGEWLELRIDTAILHRSPPKPDIRKMLIPLGPVLIFGASNFPFAYSTAGGDTACALAAGCPAIVKAHPAHAETSAAVARAIFKAAEKSQMPKGVFAHVQGAGFDTGKALLMHPYVKAVGFTGSFSGGKALFDLAGQRKEPIPVFAEMGSINPVFLFPQKLKESARDIAKLYAASITLSVGQFCTNPGLVVGIEGEDLQDFMDVLGEEIKHIAPGKMLHPGIAKSYQSKRAVALSQEEVSTLAVSETETKENEGLPTVASASAKAFLSNPVLHQEVFGPYSLIIRCRDLAEMLTVAEHLEGQLTATLIATTEDLRSNENLLQAIKNICGRLIINGVPTGVEVCLSMQHGGPFPATTDSRFTSVGADGIKRFARPMAFQGWPDSLLPQELRNENPLSLWRTVNDQLTKGRINE